MLNFQDLPDELILKILSYQRAKELISCGQVSKRIRRISHEGTLWTTAILEKKIVKTELLEMILQKGCRILNLHNSTILGSFSFDMKSQLRILKLSRPECDRPDHSKFDRYIRGEEQLTPSELSGYAIFNSEKGDCFHCHGSQMFMDNRFHNNGLDIEPFTDLGLGYVSENSNDNGKFRTPSLRNIEYTSPYMHDGRFISLEEVVNHYNSGGNYSSTVDPLMKKIGIGLQLTNEEKQDLVSFLKTLSDENFITK